MTSSKQELLAGEICQQARAEISRFLTISRILLLMLKILASLSAMLLKKVLKQLWFIGLKFSSGKIMIVDLKLFKFIVSMVTEGPIKLFTFINSHNGTSFRKNMQSRLKFTKIYFNYFYTFFALPNYRFSFLVY